MNRIDQVFIDFDGTITKEDVGVAILEKFGTPKWLDYEIQAENGEISLRECLIKQYELVKLDNNRFAEMKLLIDEIKICSSFLDFLKLCRDNRITVTILSDGMDLYIDKIVERIGKSIPGLQFPRIYSNKAERLKDGSLHVTTPYQNPKCDRCANCKRSHVERYRNSSSSPVIYIGDGISDMYGAFGADFVFAKEGKKLEKACKQLSIVHASFLGFEEVIKTISSKSFPETLSSRPPKERDPCPIDWYNQELL